MNSRSRSSASSLVLVVLASLASAASARNDHTDRIARVAAGLRPAVVFRGDPTWTLNERMEHFGVPGVAVSVIDGGEIAWTRTWGVTDRETGAPVTGETLFQAGSVSKPVAAFGALTLVGDGQLTLGGDVNAQLTSWKIPENEFTEARAVTLTHLLSHTGGLTVHGFPGYAVDEPVPTLVEVLDGSPPANTAAIRVDTAPGTLWRYSGGGYTVAQQLMIDVAGKTFPELMAARVLEPIGMTKSTFAQPLLPDQLAHAAAGYFPDGSAVPGKHHTYPEMAAAGLWTTADDLARFALEVQAALRGESAILDRELAHAMVTPVDNGYAHGFGVEHRGDGVYFSHGGWDEGFCAQLIAHRDEGQGLVVMINSNHPAFLDEVQRAVAFEYGWSGYAEHAPQPMPAGALTAYPGRYRYNAEMAFAVFREGDRLFMAYVGDDPEELVHVGDGVYLRRERTSPIRFTEEDGVAVFHFVLPDGGLQSHHRLGDDERTPRELLVESPYEDALAAYRAVLRDAPDEPTVSEGYLNDSGLILLDRGEHEQGIALLRVATDLYPDSANTWDSLGYAWRKAGDNQQAARYYRKALELEPAFPTALDALEQMESE